MGRYSRSRVLLPFVFLLCSCSSQDVVLKKQAELEARLVQVVQAQSATNGRLTELSGTVTEVQSQLKAQGLEVEQLKPGYRELKTSLESTAQKLEKLASEAASKPVKMEPVPVVVPDNKEQPKTVKPQLEPVSLEITPLSASSPVVATGHVAPAAAEPSIPLDPHAAYQKAFRLYMADKFTEALASFEGFLATYPNHEYAANAQYWIGESLYSLKNYEWSLDAFNKVVKNYPKSNKVPDAMLKGAFALFNVGQAAGGRDMLHRLVETYPRSLAAGKAKDRLDKEKKK